MRKKNRVRLVLAAWAGWITKLHHSKLNSKPCPDYRGRTGELACQLQADGVSFSDAIGRKSAQARQHAGEVLINREDRKDIQAPQPLPTIPLPRRPLPLARLPAASFD